MINNLLKDLYQQKISSENFTDEEKNVLSKPFLLKIPKKYNNRDFVVMVFGRETHRWGKLKNFSENTGIEERMDRYEQLLQFITNNRKKSKGNSCFIHRLVKINNNLKHTKTQIIWNNLLKFDKNGKSSLKNKKVYDLSIEIVRQEIEILKPDVLLFQTGSSYDRFIKDLFNNNISNSNVVVKKRLWKFEVNNMKAYRINHPCARVKGGIKQYYYKVINEIKKTQT